ncbi:MAG TPA: Gfo/Idh/MocA family oxidoreductase [Acidimicrobiia bacterium]
MIRVGVVGLGHMGRHHVRILSRLDDVEFVGGADPAGDVHKSLGGHALYHSLDDLLDAGVDAVVLATPAEDHEKAACRLASAGVHTLVEKPLASDLAGAGAIRESFAGTDLVAAVGHVERFNPALQEMKRRLEARFLGKVFAISTKRVGPFPLRVNGVGVITDLAIHDIDIVQWLIAPFHTLDSQLAHQIGTDREDLVEAVGRLADGTVVSMSVNWLTPSKQRQVTVLGERGALVADLLSSDLTYYSNSAIPVEWDEMARLKGVSEGDVTTYALRKTEPLQLELEGFRDAVLGRPDAQIVTLDEGFETMRIAAALAAGGITP